ncbi:MAG: exodeoxyribonuclease VII small subunit [Firmicutes bacterium]|nr:exodeoxyribonuclease VII small subunit [Bacillota bacterium]
MTKEIDFKNLTFEESLAKLEAVLEKLERNDCPLEEAFALFQEGMALVQFGRRKLDEVEQKVSILLKDSMEFVPFAEKEEAE